MQVIRVLVRVQPDNAPALVNQLEKEAVEVPDRFPGCQRYRLFTSPADPTEFLLYEEWESPAAFEAYKESDYFAAAGEILFPLIDGAPDSAYFDAEVVGP